MLSSLFAAPPVLGQVSPSFLIYKEGESVDLFCEAIATPEPTLTWYKSGRTLRSSKNTRIEGNRVRLTNLDRSDGGVYTCTFRNLVGQVSHVMKLVIEGKHFVVVIATVADCANFVLIFVRLI